MPRSSTLTATWWIYSHRLTAEAAQTLWHRSSQDEGSGCRVRWPRNDWTTNLPFVAEWVAQSDDLPSVSLGEFVQQGCTMLHCPYGEGGGIVGDQDESCRGTACAGRAESISLVAFVGHPEAGVTHRELRNHRRMCIRAVHPMQLHGAECVDVEVHGCATVAGVELRLDPCCSLRRCHGPIVAHLPVLRIGKKWRVRQPSHAAPTHWATRLQLSNDTRPHRYVSTRHTSATADQSTTPTPGR